MMRKKKNQGPDPRGIRKYTSAKKSTVYSPGLPRGPTA
jgi:hypothetical protein